MEVKTQTRIALGIVAFIYVMFTVVKTFFFLDQSIEFHLLTSVTGLFFIVFFGYIIRGIDIYLDKIYPFERNVIKRIVIQFLLTLVVLFLIRAVPYFLFYD